MKRIDQATGQLDHSPYWRRVMNRIDSFLVLDEKFTTLQDLKVFLIRIFKLWSSCPFSWSVLQFFLFYYQKCCHLEQVNISNLRQQWNGLNFKFGFKKFSIFQYLFTRMMNNKQSCNMLFPAFESLYLSMSSDERRSVVKTVREMLKLVKKAPELFPEVLFS